LPVDALTEAFKKLNEAAAPRSAALQRRTVSKSWSRPATFGGNSGVGQLQNANGNEERLRAIASLVDQAFEKGQRLAALDITRSFLGDKVADNLAKDAGLPRRHAREGRCDQGAGSGLGRHGG
jgi:hypothetical protein